MGRKPWHHCTKNKKTDKLLESYFACKNSIHETLSKSVNNMQYKHLDLGGRGRRIDDTTAGA